MRRRSTAPSPSPPRKKGKGRASVVHARKSKAPRSKGDALPVKVGKGTSAVAKRDPKPKTKSVPKSGNKVADPEPATQEEHAPVAGTDPVSCLSFYFQRIHPQDHPRYPRPHPRERTRPRRNRKLTVPQRPHACCCSNLTDATIASKVETLLPTAGEPVSKTARRKGPAKLPMGEPGPCSHALPFVYAPIPATIQLLGKLLERGRRPRQHGASLLPTLAPLMAQLERKG